LWRNGLIVHLRLKKKLIAKSLSLVRLSNTCLLISVLDKTDQRCHAIDMGRKRQSLVTPAVTEQHFENRVRKKIKTGMIAEIVTMENADPLDIVMSLLIDDGITSLWSIEKISSTQA